MTQVVACRERQKMETMSYMIHIPTVLFHVTPIQFMVSDTLAARWQCRSPDAKTFLCVSRCSCERASSYWSVLSGIPESHVAGAAGIRPPQVSKLETPASTLETLETGKGFQLPSVAARYEMIRRGDPVVITQSSPGSGHYTQGGAWRRSVSISSGKPCKET